VQGMPGVATLLNVRQRMTYGQYRWDEKGVPPGRVRVRVDRAAQLISVFRGPHEIGTAVVLYGVNAKPTPRGRFPVLDKRRTYWSRTYDAAMPYSLWLTGDGVAIHASDVRPGRGTNGCIGLPEPFARLLFERASKGTIVEIV
jgi:lipoprotein-anchoring transpeptidase ErfK/SrfK